LEKEENMAPLFSISPLFNRLFVLVLIAIGGAGIGLQATWLSQKSAYLAYSNVVQSTAGVSTVGSSLDLALVGAAIVTAAAFVGLVVTCVGSQWGRYVYIVSLFACFVGGVIEIVGGIAVTNSSFLTAIGPNTFSADELVAGEQLSGEAETMAMFGLATFEACCRPNGWVSQEPYGDCSVACPSAKSGEILPSSVIEPYASDISATDLCTCVRSSSNATYETIKKALTTESCNTLANIKVPFSASTTVSTICSDGTCLTLGDLDQYLVNSATITTIPLIGFELNAAADTTGNTPAGYGFGCGIGLAKGLMFTQYLYHQYYIVAGGTAALELGAATVAIIFLIVASAWYIATHLDEQEHKTAWGYETEQAMAAKLIELHQWKIRNNGGAVPMAKSVDAFGPAATQMNVPYQSSQQMKYDAPQRDVDKSSTNNVDAYGVAATTSYYNNMSPPASSAKDQPLLKSPAPAATLKCPSSRPPVNSAVANDIADKLTKFYITYDPSKTPKEIQAIAVYGAENGIEALNKKLRKKYGTDLSVLDEDVPV